MYEASATVFGMRATDRRVVCVGRQRGSGWREVCDTLIYMYPVVYDKRRLILLGLHVGDALTKAELENAVAATLRMAADVRERGKPSCVLIVVETNNTLDAYQRQRISEASRTVEHAYQAMVTKSPIVRAVATALAWLKPSTNHFHQSAHATYEEARDWLVRHSKHPPEAFDALLAVARKQVERANETSRQTRP